MTMPNQIEALHRSIVRFFAYSFDYPHETFSILEFSDYRHFAGLHR